VTQPARPAALALPRPSRRARGLHHPTVPVRPPTIRAPLVSVVIPIHNRAAFLSETVESVVGQSNGKWALLLVDDGSTDGSLRIGREYERAYPLGVRYLQHPGHLKRGITGWHRPRLPLGGDLLPTALSPSEPELAAKSIDPLYVDHLAFAAKQRVKASVAETTSAGSERLHSFFQLPLIGSCGDVAERRPVHPDQPARLAFTTTGSLMRVPDG
jgi:hypothetical protein